ncbi:MAG: hypothetical protein ACFFD7_06895 [Candidatus Thorarchaeota archaeon]
MTIEDRSQNLRNLFSEKLRNYEEILVEFLLDIARSKRVNPKISEISSYLLIHGKLTQKELKELTGFSMGSISTLLSVMTGTGTFEKERIPHTHTFRYYFSGNLEDLTIKGFEIALSSFAALETYFKNKQKELIKLSEESKRGARHLLERLRELLEIFEIYKFLYKIVAQNTTKKVRNSLIEKDFFLTKKGMSEEDKNIQFDPEIYIIEDDLLNQLAASPMFSSRDPMFIRILGYFITRKFLTQSKLQRITGLSTGKISEEVNLLLESGLIEKADISEKGKITYGAESAGIILLKFAKFIIGRMAKWDQDLQKLKKDLEENKRNLENLKGYTQLYEICDSLVKAVSKYRMLIKILDKILES